MPALLFQILTVCADLSILFFIGYYFYAFQTKEKELKKKEGKIDTEYHQVVDNALTKERTILEDASREAGQILEQTTGAADKIIADTRYISNETKDSINQELGHIAAETEKEAVDTAKNFINSYSASLETLASQSLSNFQKMSHGFEEEHKKQIEEYRKSLSQSLTNIESTAKNMEKDLQKEIKDFHDKLLPDLQKEIEEYKKSRMKQAELMISHVVQNVSQEVLNKSISLEDHQKLLIESLEKAKRDEIFN